MPQTPENIVDSMLSDLPPSSKRSMLDDNPELVRAIKHFLELKAAGDKRAHVTLRWFYHHKLRDAFSGPRSFHTITEYVRNKLKLNPFTGKAL